MASACHHWKASILSARMSLANDDSSRFFISMEVLKGMFQRIHTKFQFSSYSSAITVIIVSDGCLTVQLTIVKSFLARKINQSDVIN
jgi:hypothetical protein